jgi:cytoskeletal protein RodZ
MKEETGILGLITIRQNRGVSLEQIAKATKISVRSLEAIERGDFRKLPGGIYNTSYIRQYARAIDYDESVLLEYYKQQMSAEAPPSTTDRGKSNFGGFRPASTIAGS